MILLLKRVFSCGAEVDDLIHMYTFEENSGVMMRMYNFGFLGVQASEF